MTLVNSNSTLSQNGHPAHRIAVKNPITGALIGEIETGTPEQILLAVDRARRAQRLWQGLKVSERCKFLRKLADLLWERQREVMDTIRAETGKSDTGAFIEVAVLDSHLTWLINHAADVLAPENRAPAFPILQYARVYHKPHGVVGFITPWNYPLLLVYIDVIPALVAGNAVIIKPSEITPYSALYVLELMKQAGFPRDLVQVITGDGSTGQALIDQVDYIHFTGSTHVGKKVAAQAAARLIPYGLELGGKDAMIVLKDANLDLAAANALNGALENAGQMCISVERVYVEEAIYEPFVAKVTEYAHGLKIGAQAGFEVHVGSMTTPREVDRAEQHIADAIAKGAKLVYGGKRRPDLGPLFFEPAVLIDVDHSMDVMNEETFGPVVPIMRVRNENEALSLANSSQYGLSGLIFSNDLARAEHLATQLQTGDVSINRAGAVAAGAALPWGGQKESGIGRRGGPEGILRFTNTQSIVVDRMIGTKPSLSIVDDTIIALFGMLRTLRRYLPFV
ncbi:MAG: succinic semialdehyde dehydrogenase [Anaerolineae bacterium]|jgi:acyl-CoA reductase-like NAD-dependent aldehyde dehydrogenase|nr:succinic semialdehyde dehydrogenase [Anaerolineae bacterium]